MPQNLLNYSNIDPITQQQRRYSSRGNIHTVTVVGDPSETVYKEVLWHAKSSRRYDDHLTRFFVSFGP